MKAGISGLIIPVEWSFRQTLERITRDGYSAFEPVIRESGYLSFESSDTELKDMRDRAREAGVELVSICLSSKKRPKDLMTNDSNRRKESINTIVEGMRVANLLGVDTILLVLGSLTPELFYDDAYRNAIEAMCTIAPIAEDMGVKLAIEYVWNKFLLSPMEFARFCDEVDSPNVGFYFDPGNMAIFSYPEHWVRICSKHLMAVHMKDFKRSGFVWTPLLEGDVDFKAIMVELRKIGFNGALVSEVDAGTASFTDTVKALTRIMEM